MFLQLEDSYTCYYIILRFYPTLIRKKLNDAVMARPHFVLITYPAQGHINPTLQFAKRLVSIGVDVSFTITISARRRMSRVPNGVAFVEFSDGFDDGFELDGDNLNHYGAELSRRGSEAIARIISSAASEGRPVTCVVYTILLPWAAKVAREHHVPSVLLCVQPATVLDIYYYYFQGYGELMREKFSESNSSTFELPKLPLSLTCRDLPSFISPTTAYPFILNSFKQQIEALCEEEEETGRPTILVNTFEALEPEAIKAIDRFNCIAIGPLIPSAFLDGRDPSDNAFGGDLFRLSNDYKEWLNSKPESSVVYISFGSLALLSKEQMEEIGQALLESKRPFLWVIREPEKEGDEREVDKLICKEELEKLGLIVSWCSQVEVLSHPSLGCFLTHCGWNSTTESLVLGVPIVAFPQWTDQGTNAKLIEDVWKTGVRVKNQMGELVGRDEIKRCLDAAMDMGDTGEEMRRNARKWKELAREAVRDGGSSDKNLRAFVDKVTNANRN